MILALRVVVLVLALLLLGAAPPQNYGVLTKEALESYETVIRSCGYDVKPTDGFVVGKFTERKKGNATAYIRCKHKDRDWWIFRIVVHKFQVRAVTRLPGYAPKPKWWI